MWLLLLALIATVGVWITVSRLVRRIEGTRTEWMVVSNVLTALLAPFVIYFMASAAFDCSNAIYLRQELKGTLTPTESSSQKAGWPVCPTSYSWLQDGKWKSAVVVNGPMRPKIFIADESSP